MKKIVSIVASTFILLVGCSNESSDEAKKNEDSKPKVEKQKRSLVLKRKKLQITVQKLKKRWNQQKTVIVQ